MFLQINFMRISSIQCDMFFTITGRGLIVAGTILDGEFEIGDWFNLNENSNHPQIQKKSKQ